MKTATTNSTPLRPILALAAALAAGLATGLAGGPALAQAAPSWSLAIHGGAGVIQRDQLSPEQEAAFRAGLDQALEAGATVLRGGGSALDAVQAAVSVMEDNPLFNAGRGAVFTAAGRNELDAAIMNGADLNAGAVAGLTTTRSPIAAARAVMERSPHVMLIGAGGDAFAASAGLEQVSPAYFFTPRRWTQLRNALERQGLPVPPQPEGAPSPDGAAPGPLADLAPLDERKYGTVGAVAVDSSGHMAAATSTGGVTAKRWGRVGDAPVIGAGTYASDADGCAVSATGTGEYFIRATVARDICQRLGAGARDGVTPRAAAEAEIAEVGRLGGDGGVIVIGRDGVVGFAMNTSGMYRGQVGADTPARTAIFADEADGR